MWKRDAESDAHSIEHNVRRIRGTYVAIFTSSQRAAGGLLSAENLAFRISFSEGQVGLRNSSL